MTNEELQMLADVIYTKLTPFAWHCSCAGRHPDCAGIKDDETEQALHYQLMKVKKLIEDYPSKLQYPHHQYCLDNFPQMTSHPSDCVICQAWNDGFGTGRSHKAEQ